MKTKTEVKHDSFNALCKELGKRINGTENALLCYRAYEAYLVEHPETARGKGRGKAASLDREPSFRKAAAEASGVAPATIDALLQVGKAIEPLPQSTKETLASTSLGKSMRSLRKLATKDFEKRRAEIIETFAKQEKTDPRSARATLKKTLGMKLTGRESVEAREVVRKSGDLAQGEYLELPFDGYLIRVEVFGQAGGRVHLTAVAYQGERKAIDQFLKPEKEPPVAGRADVVAEAA